MLKNYFKMAWRNVIKDRHFTLLNVIGLSTGLACSLFILLWVTDELSVDKYNANDDRLYQVLTNVSTDAGIRTGEFTPGLLADALSDFPEVESAVSVLPASWFPFKGIITVGDKSITAIAQYVGKRFFTVFTSDFIEGDKNRLFADKQAVAISEEFAARLFGTVSGIIGRTVRWNQQEFEGDYLIIGVFKKNPGNATLQFDLLFNYAVVLERRPTLLEWTNSDPHTYVLLKKNADRVAFGKKMTAFIRSKPGSAARTLFLAKYSNKYLYGKYENGVQAGGRIAYVRLFSVIAFIIVLIACVNFMNLSTAKATRRTKEVGIKKVVGARRGMLVAQFLGESLCMAFFSLLLALIIVVTLFPAFNAITGKHLSLHFTSELFLKAALITFITGLLAGAYPAFYLSRFKPVAVLKGRPQTSFAELLARKGLVIFQFTLSVAFIVGVLIIYRQVNYIQSRNLGYNRDNILHFEIPLGMDSAKIAKAATFIEELKRVPGVVGASSYYHNLTGDHGGIGGLQWPGKNPAQDIQFSNLEVGTHFLETVGITIKQGRNFSSSANARNEIIFNEMAIEAMGLKDAVGKTITFWGMEKTIVGVAADFNFESLYHPIQPCFFQVYPVMPNVIVRLTKGSEKQTIERLQKVFNVFHPGLAFNYRFFDEEYRALYASEHKVAILSRYFAGLAVIISCLGLFGLAAFTAQKRQKEIGIRKVAGASVANVTMLLSREFMKLVLVAIVLAFPMVWWIMNNWLNDFAYRIPITVDIFAIAAATMMIITILSVSFQSIKAALANPAKSLRTE